MGCSVWYEGSSYRSRIRVVFRSSQTLFFLKHEISLTAEPNTPNDEFRRLELRRHTVTRRRLGLFRKLDNSEIVVTTVRHRSEDGKDVVVRSENRIEWDTLGYKKGYVDAFFDCKVFQDGHPIVMEYGGSEESVDE